MVDVAKVFMYGLPVGTFRWDDRYDVAQFEYDSDFVGRGIEPSPLMNESGVWKLSPAYDVGYAYNPHGGVDGDSSNVHKQQV